VVVGIVVCLIAVIGVVVAYMFIKAKRSKKKSSGNADATDEQGSHAPAAVIPVDNDAQLEGKHATALATGGGTLFCVTLWSRDWYT
jgi:hypothetical protein